MAAVTKEVVGIASVLFGQGSLSGLDFLDHECELSKDFVLDGLNLYFTAEMTCSGWTEIVGEALGPDLGVLAMAIKDFVIKAVVQGLITEVELQAWLEIELVG
ncbi:anti-lipopolysaccharide factor-like isoform X2 [Eriocheir sinensis]|uniref:anti-lipopolysaccharide factor-like isoform X2 n=1 Tax=Eriocheir sinensis TaxID=95602 RepID=UPI0021CA42FE|nr:anti-lipopolysaccharide factor-like isoform X2 [Eriocheir sinensis]